MSNFVEQNIDMPQLGKVLVEVDILDPGLLLQGLELLLPGEVAKVLRLDLQQLLLDPLLPLPLPLPLLLSPLHLFRPGPVGLVRLEDLPEGLDDVLGEASAGHVAGNHLVLVGALLWDSWVESLMISLEIKTKRDITTAVQISFVKKKKDVAVFVCRKERFA